jgi:hypothetical protein
MLTTHGPRCVRISAFYPLQLVGAEGDRPRARSHRPAARYPHHLDRGRGAYPCCVLKRDRRRDPHQRQGDGGDGGGPSPLRIAAPPPALRYRPFSACHGRHAAQASAGEARGLRLSEIRLVSISQGFSEGPTTTFLSDIASVVAPSCSRTERGRPLATAALALQGGSRQDDRRHVADLRDRLTVPISRRKHT